MVLALADVAYRRGGRWVLAHVDLAVAAGSRALLTGANGAGKTTLLRLAATALRPHRGSLQLFGRGGAEASAHARPRLALMTHQDYFYAALPAAQNLAVVARLRGVPAPAPALLAGVGLGGVGERPVGRFSAGMRRRLGLARLLLLAPALALLDEPFGQLDPDGVALMEAAIGRLAAAGCAIVMATHDVARGRALADQHVHLEAGELVPGRPS